MPIVPGYQQIPTPYTPSRELDNLLLVSPRRPLLLTNLLVISRAQVTDPHEPGCRQLPAITSPVLHLVSARYSPTACRPPGAQVRGAAAANAQLLLLAVCGVLQL